ncbi:MAG: hypothetical protein JSR31_05880 [Nitrospira sp.]|nr:hypothetical protein [Nitrospira sp.]
MGRILSNRQVIAAKVETTEGAAISLAGADANNLIMEPKFDPDVPMYERTFLDNSLSPQKAIATTRMARLSFKVECKGSGAAGTAPALGKLLKACGFGETIVASTSVTYAPISALASIPTLSLAIYKDGLRKAIKGARGNVKYSAKAGEPGMFEFEFVGVYDGTTDVAILTPSGVETTVPVSLLSATFSIASFAAFVSQITFDMGNTLTPRGDINQSSGYISTLLTKRNPKGSFDPEDELVATHDFYGRWLAGTTGALTWKHPGSAGNITTFTVPACQYMKMGEGDRNGIAILNADFLMARNSIGGDDELSIAFT